MPRLVAKRSQAKTLPLRRVREATTSLVLADLQTRVDTQERAISAISATLHALAMERNARHAARYPTRPAAAK